MFKDHRRGGRIGSGVQIFETFNLRCEQGEERKEDDYGAPGRI